MGAKLIRQAAGLTNDTAGDGTTTSILLASELLLFIILNYIYFVFLKKRAKIS